MKKQSYDEQRVIELLYQALETEQNGMRVYEHALRCARDPRLQKEWSEYLEETKYHEDVLLGVFTEAGLDPSRQTPGRDVVRTIGEALVHAMEQALEDGEPQSAELVAGECVVLAETKDHLNWELLSQIAEHGQGPLVEPLRKAVDEVIADENHHLYHTKGWTRELWLDALGFPAVLPPPEEVKNVETAIGASRAEKARERMLSSH